LTSYPVVLLSLAVPLAWRNRSDAAIARLRWFIAAILILFLINGLTICLFNVAGGRYELDFLPELMLLSVIGILCLDCVTLRYRALRLITGWSWAVLLLYSLGFNGLLNVEAHAEVDCLEGNTFFHHDRFDDALNQYQQAEALWPDCADAHYGHGNALVKEGYMDAAVAEYQNVLEIAPDYALAYGCLGYCFLQTGSASDAVLEYRKAVGLEPGSIDFRYGLGNALLSQGNSDMAMIQYQKALEIQPHTAEEYSELALFSFRMGRRDAAIVQYKKAVDLDPASADYHALFGTALLVNGRFDEAIAQYRETIKLQPDYRQAHVLLGDAFSKKGDFDQAIVQYQKGVELQPDSAQGHNSLANAFLHKGHLAKAIEQWKLALQFMPDLESAQLNLAWVLATAPDPSLRDGSNAIVLAKRANELAKGSDPSAVRCLAAALAENGQYADAVAAAMQAIQLSRGEPAMAVAVKEQLKYYRSHQPFRDQTLGGPAKIKN
jgi:tetratricopeptide (TPR) repeat protein